MTYDIVIPLAKHGATRLNGIIISEDFDELNE